MCTSHRVSAVLIACLVLVAGAAAATKPKPKPNDGLPTKWFGSSDSMLRDTQQGADYVDSYDIATSTAFTLKLAKKTRTIEGLIYEYAVSSGSFFIKSVTKRTNVAGTCTNKIGPVTIALIRGDGTLNVFVPKRGKRPTYDATSGASTRQPLTETVSCPSFVNTGQTSLRPWMSFPPRKLNTAALKLEGTYEVPGGYTFKWCLARTRALLLSCLD